MDEKWTKVYTVERPYNAELIKGMLEEQGINCVIMNKRDSELPVGDVELYVENENAGRAKQIISEQNKSE
ncbi:MAG: DUF2007 domain-containing protein [Bacteroidales bacterium]